MDGLDGLFWMDGCFGKVEIVVILLVGGVGMVEGGCG